MIAFLIALLQITGIAAALIVWFALLIVVIHLVITWVGRHV